MNAVELINRESELLDKRHYEPWGELFTEDCRYWAPYEWDAPEPRNAINVIYDDHARLQDRIARVTGGDFHSQDPPSHTVRLIGTIHRIEAPPEWTPAQQVDEVYDAAFRLSELRRDKINDYVGRYTYWLRQTPEGLRIVGKKVQLLGASLPQTNLTFLL